MFSCKCLVAGYLRLLRAKSNALAMTWLQQTKTSRPQMGREEDSRGTTQVNCFRRLWLAITLR